MKTIAIAKFKATCLSILEHVRKTGEPILITQRGIPIAQVLPPPPPAPNEQSAFGCMAGTAKEIEDILEPLPEDDWDMLK
ncbi:MAG TPA: type II toxin-antitoxin system prevent-host-death family antitoxin [Candidatus Entotheonella sp.]|jgi:prevent-host-death family protein